MKTFNKIFASVMIIVFAAILVAGISLDVKNHFKTNYDLPLADKETNRKVEIIKKECVLRDSLQTKKNKVQNNFIFENRIVLDVLLKNDSITKEALKDISIAVNVLLLNNDESTEKLKEIKELLGDNKPTEENTNTIVEYIK